MFKRSWLRHYATSRKVAGSILVKVFFFFFNLTNPSFYLDTEQCGQVLSAAPMKGVFRVGEKKNVFLVERTFGVIVE
jgi:hypothetical protein